MAKNIIFFKVSHSFFNNDADENNAIFLEHCQYQVAEGAGFEPAIPFGIRAFQARALGRYATPPK